jgi:hypothetical protein
VILISGSIFEDKRTRPDERGTAAYLEKREVPEHLRATIVAFAADTIRSTAWPNGRLTRLRVVFQDSLSGGADPVPRGGESQQRILVTFGLQAA